MSTEAELVPQLRALGIPDWDTARWLMDGAAKRIESQAAEIERLKAEVEALSPRRNVSPPADTLILHKMRYHYWEADGDDPADFELFDAGVECDTCIDVYIVRADKLDAQTALLRQALDAMQWEVGGEPLPTLMMESIAAIKQPLGEV